MKKEIYIKKRENIYIYIYNRNKLNNTKGKQSRTGNTP